jgi:arylsulfatase
VRGRDNDEHSSLCPAAGQKPNILFIMGDDIGWMQPSIYHQA